MKSSRLVALAFGLASLVVAARGHVGRLLRTIDQRASFLGAAIYGGVAQPLLRPLYRRVAVDVGELGRVLRPRGVGLIYDFRPFAYLLAKLEVFVARTRFERTAVDRAPLRLVPLPAAFVRIRLVRPPEG